MPDPRACYCGADVGVLCFSPEKRALAHYLMLGVTSPLSYDLETSILKR
jgi:hypothetical protein